MADPRYDEVEPLREWVVWFSVSGSLPDQLDEALANALEPEGDWSDDDSPALNTAAADEPRACFWGIAQSRNQYEVGILVRQSTLPQAIALAHRAFDVAREAVGLALSPLAEITAKPVEQVHAEVDETPILLLDHRAVARRLGVTTTWLTRLIQDPNSQFPPGLIIDDKTMYVEHLVTSWAAGAGRAQLTGAMGPSAGPSAGLFF